MTDRKPINKSTRFEVFKRDSFQCQYCGATSPNVVLHVDHIHPVSKGGDNDALNLITACERCNAGKSDKELDDNAAISKQREQLEELNARREQLEMMLEWRESMRGIGDREVDAATDLFENLCNESIQVNDAGRSGIKKLIRKYGINEVLDAIEEGAESYLKFDDNGNCDNDSAALALNRLGGILRVRQAPEGSRQLFYIRGILRNRLRYCNEGECIRLLKEAHAAGSDTEELTSLAKEVRNWTAWREEMTLLIESAEA